MMFRLDWIGLSVPIAYIAVLVSSLVTFSSVYRKRKAAIAASLEPWFPPHIQRDIYLSLMYMKSEGESKATIVPDGLKRAALLRRAVEDIFRIIEIRNTKQPCSTSLQRGTIGDDLWQMFLRAEEEMERELEDVVAEANELQSNWGQTIFITANEIAANTMIRRTLEEVQAQVASEKKWWDKRRECIKTEFLKELDAEQTNQSRVPTASSEEDVVLVDVSSDKVSSRTKKNKK